MKYTEKKKYQKHQRELFARYKLEQFRTWCGRFAVNKEKRNRAKQHYNFIYRHNDDFEMLPKHDSSLPPNYYIKPRYIITSDLVSSKDLNRVKKGIRKLLLKQHSNKYFFAADKTQEDIDALRSYEPGAEFYESIGLIDFGNYDALKTIIEDVEISIMNLNDSHFLLVLQIQLSDRESKELGDLISSNYYVENSGLKERFAGKHRKKPKDKTNKGLQIIQSERMPGGVTSVERVYYNGSIKTKALDEEYDSIKEKIFMVISKYLDLELYSRHIIQPAYIIYESNIDECQDISDDFLRSMNIPHGDGNPYLSFPIFRDNPNEDMIGYDHSEGHSETNRYILFFDQRVHEDQRIGYNNKGDYILFVFSNLYKTFARYDYRTFLYDEYRDTIIDFRDQIDNLKENSRSYKRVLKIRKQFYHEINFYQNISRVSNAYVGEIKTADSLPWIDLNNAEGICTHFKHRSIKRLNNYYQSVRREINDKTALCKDLMDKHQIVKTNIISLLALIIAALTLIVTVYPSSGETIDAIEKIINCVVSSSK